MSAQACGCPTSTQLCSTMMVTSTHWLWGSQAGPLMLEDFRLPFPTFSFLVLNFVRDSLVLNIHRAFPEPPPGAQTLLGGQASGLAAQALV